MLAGLKNKYVRQVKDALDDKLIRASPPAGAKLMRKCLNKIHLDRWTYPFHVPQSSFALLKRPERTGFHQVMVLQYTSTQLDAIWFNTFILIAKFPFTKYSSFLNYLKQCFVHIQFCPVASPFLSWLIDFRQSSSERGSPAFKHWDTSVWGSYFISLSL